MDLKVNIIYKSYKIREKMVKKRKCRNCLKILLIMIVIILICLTGLQIAINPLAKKIVSQKITPLFGDKLTIGSIGISIFRGSVIIKNIELLQPPGFTEGNFLKTQAVLVRVALLPLLKKQLVIYGITIVQPEINLVQLRNGRINTTYFLSKMGKASSSASQEKSFNLNLNRLSIRKGKVVFYGYKMSSKQPTFLLTDLNLNLKDVNIPNEKNTTSSFSLSGTIASAHPATIHSNGSGVFLAGPVSFQAETEIKKISPGDFDYLYPNTPVTIQEGTVYIHSDAECTRNYLIGNQHVQIRDLRIADKKESFLGKTILGLPADGFAKILQDENNSLEFDFKVAGNLSNLKVDIKEVIGRAIAGSIKDKIGPRIMNLSKKAIEESVKKIGSESVESVMKEIDTKTGESVKELLKFGK